MATVFGFEGKPHHNVWVPVVGLHNKVRVMLTMPSRRSVEAHEGKHTQPNYYFLMEYQQLPVMTSNEMQSAFSFAPKQSTAWLASIPGGPNVNVLLFM